MTGELEHPGIHDHNGGEPSATDVYALGRDPGEGARLQRQSEELRSDSAALLLLLNVTNPKGVVTEMTRLARPGGVVALQEPDSGAWVCDPPHPA